MEEYIFSSHWIRVEDTLPPNATHCLVTDGEMVVTATYIIDGDKQVWVFNGLDDDHKFTVAGWMPMPRPLKLPVLYNEKINTEN